MTPPANFVLISQTNRDDESQVKQWAKDIDAQLREDLFKIWGRRASMQYLEPTAKIPNGFWPIFIRDQSGEPGALGYHSDEHGQPYAVVAYDGDSTSVTISHEAIETVIDPFGRRLIPINLGKKFGDVRVLVEACDPPEARDYKKGGSAVSDFITPEWYDAHRQSGLKYSFRDNISGPRLLLPGGYFSFIDSHGSWWQQTFFGGTEPIFTRLGRKENDHRSLREWVDSKTVKP